MIDETIDGRYEIVRFIGEGGMGAVYEARHVATRRRVALKLISEEAANDPERLARFRVEAKAAGRIDSDHITQVFDLGHDDERDTPYMAMEYLEGEDLEVLFERRGRLPLHLGLRIVCQALYGLSRAHEAGVTHRDIKPANIFLSKRDNGRCVVKLLDFGIAKIRKLDAMSASSSGITSAGILIGSPLYMSPEQTKTFKGLDPRTDVWSMGVVLYQALVGVTPFETDAGIGDLILSINTDTVIVRERAPWVPEPVAKVIEKALTVSGKGRYQNATEMAAAMDALLPRGAEIDHEELEGELGSGEEEMLGDTLAVVAPEPPPSDADEDEAPTRVRHSVPSYDDPSYDDAPFTLPNDGPPAGLVDAASAPATVPSSAVAADEGPPTTVPAEPAVTAREEPITLRTEQDAVPAESVEGAPPKREARAALPVPVASTAKAPSLGRALVLVGAVGLLVTGVAAFALRETKPAPAPTSTVGSGPPSAPTDLAASSAPSVEPTSGAASTTEPEDDAVAGPMPTAAWSSPPPTAPATVAPPPTAVVKPTATATPPKPEPPEPIAPKPEPPKPEPPKPIAPKPEPVEPVPPKPDPPPSPEPVAPETVPEPAPPEPVPEPADPKPAPPPTPPIAPKL